MLKYFNKVMKQLRTKQETLDQAETAVKHMLGDQDEVDLGNGLKVSRGLNLKAQKVVTIVSQCGLAVGVVS
jgi:membrane peptidoglycan carboxypeptidase